MAMTLQEIQQLENQRIIPFREQDLLKIIASLLVFEPCNTSCAQRHTMPLSNAGHLFSSVA